MSGAHAGLISDMQAYAITIEHMTAKVIDQPTRKMIDDRKASIAARASA